MICVNYDPNPEITFDGSPGLFRNWLEDNSINFRGWGNAIGNKRIFGFEIFTEEDYMAIKLRWK